MLLFVYSPRGHIFEKHKVKNHMDYSKCILLPDAIWIIHLDSG